MKNIIISLLLLLSINGVLHSAEPKPDPKHKVKIGDIAPDFTIQFLDGTKQKLSQHRGKVIMLQFTASWCSVCRKEMPFIEKEIHQVLNSDDNFLLIGIDLKEDKATIEKFQKATGITYPIVLDTDGKIFELYAEAEAGVTRNVIIDKDGKVAFLTRLFDREEFDAMKSKINELLETK